MTAAPNQCQPATEDLSEGFAILRELEVAWLTAHLSDSIANLGYPVGMGMAPHPDQIKKAATTLFERYAKMIEMARGMPRCDAVTDEVVERAWAAIVGNDIAAMCFNASIIRADLKTALIAALSPSSNGEPETAVTPISQAGGT